MEIFVHAYFLNEKPDNEKLHIGVENLNEIKYASKNYITFFFQISIHIFIIQKVCKQIRYC